MGRGFFFSSFSGPLAIPSSIFFGLRDGSPGFLSAFLFYCGPCLDGNESPFFWPGSRSLLL